MTKKYAIEQFKYYEKSDMYSIYDAYGRPSYRKVEAWNRCKDMAREYHGESLKVISHNTYMFTAGFTFEADGKKMFMMIAPSSNLAVEIGE